MHYGVCALCGKTGWLEDHHVFGGPLRKKSDAYGLVIGLCGESCHRLGRKAVHQCRETALSLKAHYQVKCMQEHGMSIRQFILEFGKSYVPADYYDERNMTMNSCAITGRLTREPELRYTGSQVPVCTFTLAVQRPGSRDKTDFVDCVAWRERAEFLTRNFHKGMRIEVSGYISTRRFEKNGSSIKATEIVADNLFFGEPKRDADGSEAAPSETGSGENQFQELDGDGEELPF